MIINNPTLLPLNQQNKKELKTIVSFGTRLAKRISISVTIILLSYLLFVYSTNTLKGFIQIAVIALSSFILGLILFFNDYFKTHLDLKSNLKIRITLNDYEIINGKKDTFLKTTEPKLRIALDQDLLPHININQPITIEITKRSKSLLFISHNENNLLD